MITALTTAVLALLWIRSLDLLDRAERSARDAGAWLDHQETLGSVASIDELVWLVAGIALIVWLSRYVDNIPSLGGGLPKRSPRRTIIYWLVPVINFIFLPLILRDGGKRMVAQRGDHGGLIAAWWVSWVGWIVPFIVLLMAIPEDGSVDAQRQILQLDVATGVIFVIQAALSVVMIRRMQADEDYWAEQRPRAPSAPAQHGPGRSDELHGRG